MKKLFFIALAALLSFAGEAQTTLDSIAAKSLHDIPYGKGERNQFDLYLPETDVPTPLVIFYHGGGFTEGDKSLLLTPRHLPIATELLKNGIAVATVNYSYRRSDDGKGIRQSICDAVDFLQFIRLHAAEYGIDKNRVAAYGNSAGAGISLYLAFHDQMADPLSEDPSKRESTRISCAGALDTQATYDLLQWRRFIPGMGIAMLTKKKLFHPMISEFYGYTDYKEFSRHKKELRGSLDMLSMISPDDAPVFLCNPLPGGIPKDMNQLLHHPSHAAQVAKKARKSGLPIQDCHGSDPTHSLTRFLIDCLQ